MFRFILALSVILFLSPACLAADKPPEAPLDQKNITATALSSWVALALPDLLTYGYDDYMERFKQTARYFTIKGWGKYVEALERSRRLESMTQYKTRIGTRIKGDPVLVNEGVLEGRHRWVFVVPVVSTHHGSAKP